MNSLRLPAILAACGLASCGVEEIELASEVVEEIECMVCDDLGSCEPVANGTPCTSGSCLDGGCVASVCESGERFVAVAAGENHTCALGFTGNLYCWGRNDEGQLGLGDLDERLEPTLVGSYRDWESIAAGWKHSCGERGESTWCWGDNRNGELGAGDQESPRSEPVELAGDSDQRSQLTLGQGHSCAVGRTGDLWCWGSNSAGQLGLGDGELRTLPSQLPAPVLVWRQAAAGAHHTCAVDWDGGLWCWGDNPDGRLGLGDTTDRSIPELVGEGIFWRQVSGGGGHSCAIDGTDRLFCWGRNTDGEVGAGSGSGDTLLEPTAVSSSLRWAEVSLGDRHSCATTHDGSLWCWGRNDKAQLGLGDIDARAAPVQLGSAVDWSQLSAGKRHTCGLRSNGALLCWGLNDSGQLGLGDLLTREWPTQVCPTSPVEP